MIFPALGSQAPSWRPHGAEPTPERGGNTVVNPLFPRGYPHPGFKRPNLGVIDRRFFLWVVVKPDTPFHTDPRAARRRRRRNRAVVGARRPRDSPKRVLAHANRKIAVAGAPLPLHSGRPLITGPPLTRVSQPVEWICPRHHAGNSPLIRTPLLALVATSALGGGASRPVAASPAPSVRPRSPRRPPCRCCTASRVDSYYAAVVPTPNPPRTPGSLRRSPHFPTFSASNHIGQTERGTIDRFSTGGDVFFCIRRAWGREWPPPRPPVPDTRSGTAPDPMRQDAVNSRPWTRKERHRPGDPAATWKRAEPSRPAEPRARRSLTFQTAGRSWAAARAGGIAVVKLPGPRRCGGTTLSRRPLDAPCPCWG